MITIEKFPPNLEAILKEGHRGLRFRELYGTFNEPPPNWQEITHDAFWRLFGNYGVGRAQDYRQLWRDGKYIKSAHLFFYSDGTGLAVSVKYSYTPNGASWTPTFYSFALCVHQRVSTLDTNRGWHKGHCEKCGCDMSYDSGD